MTRFLRTSSPRRLMALLLGIVVAIAAGAAIAVAASGSGPVPPHRTLAQAVRGALSARQVQGVTARVNFTNHLIDASDLRGSNPLLSGASGRLWISNDGRARLELQSDNGDAQAVLDHNSFWLYDPSSNTVYEGTVPAQAASARETRKEHRSAGHKIPSIAEIQRTINHLSQHLAISGAKPGDVAGHPAYTVRIGPRQAGGLLGAGELAWDAVRGVPLRVGVYARGESTPVLELKATDVSYGAVPASDFSISPPSGAKVVRIDTAALQHRAGTTHAKGHHAEVSGAAAVARHLAFPLAAPASLAGLGRQSVHLLDWKGHPAALLTYGQGLGGVAVIQQSGMSSPAHSASNSSGDSGQGLSLPTVQINGSTAQELDTALGTVITFTRGGVSYTVLGSVSPATAKAAARAL